MHALTLALSAAALALGITSAQASLTPMVDRPIGTLSCVARADLGLLVGRGTAADCTFVPIGGGTAQTYLALLPETLRRDGASGATFAWRVLTRRGIDRPGMLAGAFADPAAWFVGPRPAAAGLIGQAAILRPNHDAAGEVSAPLPRRLDLAALASTDQASPEPR